MKRPDCAARDVRDDAVNPLNGGGSNLQQPRSLMRPYSDCGTIFCRRLGRFGE